MSCVSGLSKENILKARTNEREGKKKQADVKDDSDLEIAAGWYSPEPKKPTIVVVPCNGVANSSAGRSVNPPLKSVLLPSATSSSSSSKNKTQRNVRFENEGKEENGTEKEKEEENEKEKVDDASSVGCESSSSSSSSRNLTSSGSDERENPQGQSKGQNKDDVPSDHQKHLAESSAAVAKTKSSALKLRILAPPLIPDTETKSAISVDEDTFGLGFVNAIRDIAR